MDAQTSSSCPAQSTNVIVTIQAPRMMRQLVSMITKLLDEANADAENKKWLLAASARLDAGIMNFDKEIVENVKKDKDEVSVQDSDIKVN